MGPVDRSVVVVAFTGFAITAEINPDEPSAVASCDDLRTIEFPPWLATEAHTLATSFQLVFQRAHVLRVTQRTLMSLINIRSFVFEISARVVALPIVV
jgi:hypothetical protein